MTDNHYKSYLSDKLEEKYGNVCSICGNPDELVIDYIHGQEYLESEYFESLKNRYMYYLAYFDEESDFLGLIHKQCKPDYEPKQPTLEETMMNINELIKEDQFQKIDEFVKRYPHTIPVVGRMYREGMAESEQERNYHDY